MPGRTVGGREADNLEPSRRQNKGIRDLTRRSSK